ncbi:hypothetical protein POM88_024433 [Heracleum sosnowskyi]|uniref:Nuclear pore complex protein GP210 C-terminal Ig-like domain-containing protein n=1 Tax=Heracleum sosnowskyi TaxID=360622 RepID=A0AAD8MMA6_9APIA|nr:hypothetical protein POM88_024433 [Heracleum sosnowskyi]
MSRSAPGDTIIHCEVYFDKLTRIQIFDNFVKDHSDGIIASIGMSKENTSVSVDASSRGAKEISGPGSATFTGGFGMLKIYDNSVILLNLPSNSNKSVITVIDNTDIEAQWQHRDQVQITRIHREIQGIASHDEYEVKVHIVKGLKDKVIISIGANGQRVEIDVNYEPEKAISTSDKAMDKFLNICYYIVIVLFISMAIGYAAMDIAGYT